MTKQDMVLKHLQKYHNITPLEALKEYGSMRLGAIIFELRKQYKIKTKMITVPTRHGTATVAQYQDEGLKWEKRKHADKEW